MRKKRILFVGEASFLATGFSTYWNEVLKRLNATGEFEIAELGSYTNPGDHRCRQVPWKFYPVAPDPNDKESAGRYNAGMPTAQFGEWCFDDVCLEFKPDIVCGIRDWWMDEFVLRSPFRKNFKFMWMPTIDGAPQRELWLDGYKLCDSILTYSKWGMNLLKETGRQDTNLVAVASPGADIETFAPIQDKGKHKQAVGLPPDANIIGTVMRNQKRKLYVNLIEDFAVWLKKAKSKSKAGVAQKTFLYLHTSYPDVGYDIGKAIREFKVGKHVLMTYLCRNCNTAYPSLFKGEIAVCRRCNQYKAQPPNATHHCPRNVLASIMNLFDLYVQYSICEGWGMPLTEAASCGVPFMAVDYSAMVDHLENPGGIPINVGKFFYEPVIETEQKRALPDTNDFVTKLDNFLKMSPDKRQEMGNATRAYITEPVDTYGEKEKMPRYSWERTTAIWMNAIRDIDVPDHSETWLRPEADINQPRLVTPKANMNNAEFTRWLITDVLKRPELAYTQFAGDWIRSLNCSYLNQGQNIVPFDRKKLVQIITGMVEKQNRMERKRVEKNSAEQTEGFGVVTV